MKARHQVQEPKRKMLVPACPLILSFQPPLPILCGAFLSCVFCVLWRSCPQHTDHHPSEEGHEERGAELCRQIYGDDFSKLRQNMVDLHPALDRWCVRQPDLPSCALVSPVVSLGAAVAAVFPNLSLFFVRQDGRARVRACPGQEHWRGRRGAHIAFARSRCLLFLFLAPPPLFFVSALMSLDVLVAAVAAELCVLAVLSGQNVRPQLISHVLGAVRCGATWRECKDVLVSLPLSLSVSTAAPSSGSFLFRRGRLHSPFPSIRTPQNLTHQVWGAEAQEQCNTVWREMVHKGVFKEA